jgi:Fe-S cluster biosynthesis and repair protein YggX
MTPDPARLAQFRKMAADDPDNELGHFSLGRELHLAGDHDAAIASFDRVIALKSDFSKAYQLKAEAELAAGREDAAIQTLKTGVVVAAKRGDTIPKDAMAAKLAEHGHELPEEAKRVAPKIEVGEGQVFDVRTGQPGSRMKRQPFRNRLGELIYANISQESWEEWKGMGTKVINELRLPLSDPKAQEMFDQHMIEFLNLGDLIEQDKQK